jgi:fatty acid amide hydrolase
MSSAQQSIEPYFPYLTALGLTFISAYLLNLLNTKRIQSKFTSLARAKLAQRDSRREELKKLINKFLPTQEEHDLIYNLSASQLLNALELGDITATAITAVFSYRALRLDHLIHAVTEENYDRALQLAQEIDAKRAKSKKPRRNSQNLIENRDYSEENLLLGIPFTVKDQINMAGFDSSMGCAAENFCPRENTSLLVELLTDMGGIPLCRSNTIQSMMLPESANATYGRSNNPWDLSRTPGGSSGGEAALIAARISPMGIGTDIGGSIRIPAAFCSIYALKPSPGRVSYSGISVPRLKGTSGNNDLKACIGPMANSTADLALIMRSWLGNSKHFARDQLVPYLPWDNEKFLATEEKLTLGYYWDDGFFPASPACQRAVELAVQKLTQLGHKCVKIKPYKVEVAVKVYFSIVSADGGKAFKQFLRGEKLHDYYSKIFASAAIPRLVRPILAKFLQFIGQKRAALILAATGAKTAYEYQCIVRQSQDYVAEFLGDLCDQEIDCLICPVNALPAFTHGASKDLSPACVYTFLYNLLPLAAGVVPVTRVQAHEQHYDDNIGDVFSKAAKKVCEKSAGAPIAVQIVSATTWNDELVLRVMKQLEDSLNFTEIPDLAKNLKVQPL